MIQLITETPEWSYTCKVKPCISQGMNRISKYVYLLCEFHRLSKLFMNQLILQIFQKVLRV